jgi:hypothetical protein
VRAAFTDVSVDDDTRKRVLTSVYRRVRPAGGLQSMRASAVRIAIMFVVMAAILATLFVRGSRLPMDTPVQEVPGTTVTPSRPYPADKIASAVDFPVLWLSRKLGDLQFTGVFRRTENSTEYSSHVGSDNVTIQADNTRPKLSPVQVTAEYSPKGKPANEEQGQTTPGVKVISMPRTDPSGWERAFREARGNMYGEAQSADITWTTVGGHKALHMRHEWRWGNGTPKGHVTMSVDYLAIDYGDATVLVQGANTPRGHVQKVANDLQQVR